MVRLSGSPPEGMEPGSCLCRVLGFKPFEEEATCTTSGGMIGACGALHQGEAGLPSHTWPAGGKVKPIKEEPRISLGSRTHPSGAGGMPGSEVQPEPGVDVNRRPPHLATGVCGPLWSSETEGEVSGYDRMAAISRHP